MFESELRRGLISMSDITSEENLPRILKRLAYSSLDDLFAAIGYGGASAQKAANKVKDELRTIEKSRKKDDLDISPAKIQKKTKPVHGIVVEGLDNCLIKFSRCCTPVPGDDIAGFITRGFGISVHRKDCKNYLKSITNPDEKDRWINVEWATDDFETYNTSLTITAHERSGLVMDVATVLSSTNTKMTTFNARDVNGMSIVFLTLELHNNRELRTLITKLSAISGVTHVERNGG